jgi:DNA-binding NtrC family response regulator
MPQNQHRIHVIDRPQHIETMMKGGLFYYLAEMTFSINKREALNELSKRPGDIIISGLDFEDGTVVDLVNELKQLTGKIIPGLYLSDPKQASSTVTNEDLYRLGALDILQRPIDVNLLCGKLDQAVTLVRQYRQPSLVDGKQESGRLPKTELEQLMEESRAQGISISELVARKQVSK